MRGPRPPHPRIRCFLLPKQLFFPVCGIPDEQLVEAHGSFSTASCHLCYTTYPAAEAKVNPAVPSEKKATSNGGD